MMAVAGHSFPARLPREFQPWADLLLVAESMAFHLGYNNGACQAKNPEVIPELVLQRLQHMNFDARDCCALAERITQQIEREGWMRLVSHFTN
jgi:hypothetical protein